mmetsp:Transcript_68159/g.197587  ORF Transcript_68159/g.197587 Transcript_68159/m.197587 type:complete len:300 (+) Transcript_68159:256-1155(+)
MHAHYHARRCGETSAHLKLWNNVCNAFLLAKSVYSIFSGARAFNFSGLSGLLSPTPTTEDLGSAPLSKVAIASFCLSCISSSVSGVSSKAGYAPSAGVLSIRSLRAALTLREVGEPGWMQNLVRGATSLAMDGGARGVGCLASCLKRVLSSRSRRTSSSKVPVSFLTSSTAHCSRAARSWEPAASPTASCGPAPALGDGEGDGSWPAARAQTTSSEPKSCPRSDVSFSRSAYNASSSPSKGIKLSKQLASASASARSAAISASCSARMAAATSLRSGKSSGASSSTSCRSSDSRCAFST